MNRKPFSIRPRLTMSEIYGHGLIYNPRASFRNYGALAADPLSLDVRTGGALSVAGDMPTICFEGAAPAAGFALWETAGLGAVPVVISYGCAAEYEQCLARAGAQGQRLVFQHVHAPGERSAEQYWVPPELLSYLNDKGRLGELVPAEHVPPRRLIARTELSRLAGRRPELPLVVKGSGPQSSGGGFAVVIAHRPGEVLAASERLSDFEFVVLERFLEAQSNHCLNFAALPDGTVEYLGAAEQIVTAAGTYEGNWLDSQCEPPPAAIDVGREIMRRAGQLGYRGVAGFDVLVDTRGKLWVIDLNFRLNGSTPAVLWQSALRELLRPGWVARFQRVPLRGGLSANLGRLRNAIRRQELFPLAAFEPPHGARRALPASVDGLWLGATRAEVLARRDALVEHRGPLSRAA